MINDRKTLETKSICSIVAPELREQLEPVANGDDVIMSAGR